MVLTSSIATLKTKYHCVKHQRLNQKVQILMCEINLLGKPQIISGGKVLNIRSPRIHGLLAFIYSETRLVTRKELYQFLWADYDKEEKEEVYAGRLRVLIYSIRDYSHHFLRVETKGLSLVNEGFADINDFRSLSEDKDIRNSLKLIELYKGEFLEGVGTSIGSDKFNSWLELQRNYYQYQVLEALDIVINHFLKGRRASDLKDVLHYIQKSKAINPWRSDLHIQIANAFMKEQKPEKAIIHLEDHIAKLNDRPSLGVSAELIDLLKHLKSTNGNQGL